LSEGACVFGVDNFSTGVSGNLSDAVRNPAFQLLTADVSHDFDDVISRAAAPDIVLHLASAASPLEYSVRSIETMEVNSAGSAHCLEWCKRVGARFVFASTSEAYGDPTEHPQSEEYWGNVNPIGPRSCYDESKRFGEALSMAYSRLHGVDVRIARVFNTYGPRMRAHDGRVVPNFIRQALCGDAVTVYGEGSQTRSFCFVEDLCEGLYRLATRQSASGTVVNLGNPDERTIAELAEVVSRLIGVPLRVEHGPLPVDDPRRRCPDISRAKRLLGWEPTTNLEEGLSKTIAYFRGELVAAK
jgi:nucleoside-diphosphate-sugar epimerase